MVRDLLARGVVITVGGDGFHAQALQRDQHLLAKLAGAEQHDFGCVGGQGGAEGGHGMCRRWVSGRIGRHTNEPGAKRRDQHFTSPANMPGPGARPLGQMALQNADGRVLDENGSH